MRRPILWFTAATVVVVVAGTFSVGRTNAVGPMPEVSLGVMKSCAHLGALARRIALDRTAGIPIDEARYRDYRNYLIRRRSLFRSPDFAVLLAYRSDELQPETIRNLGVQTCVAAYYGFRAPAHHESLHREALACQQASHDGDNGALGLDDCMGREYQSLLAQWWQDANDAQPFPGAAAHRPP